MNKPGIRAFDCPYFAGSMSVYNGIIRMRAILNSWRQASQGPEG